MVDNLGGTGKQARIDPFPLDLLLNAFSISVSIASLYVSMRPYLLRQKKTQAVRTLFERVVQLHRSVDEAVILLASYEPELGTEPVRLRGRHIFLEPVEAIRFGRIDRQMGRLLRDVKNLAAEVRESYMEEERTQEYFEVDDDMLSPIDDLIANLSTTTFAEFLRRLRQICRELERFLMTDINQLTRE